MYLVFLNKKVKYFPQEQGLRLNNGICRLKMGLLKFECMYSNLNGLFFWHYGDLLLGPRTRNNLDINYNFTM